MTDLQQQLANARYVVHMKDDYIAHLESQLSAALQCPDRQVETMTVAELAQSVKAGENWKVADQPGNAAQDSEQERRIEELQAETRRAYNAMNAAETQLIMERERGDMWQQKYLDLAVEAKPEGKICEMWGVWYEGSRVGVSGWVEDGSGIPELFPSVDKARLFCPSSAYQVRPIVMYAAPVQVKEK